MQSILTPAIQKSIVDLIMAGNYISTAVRASGVAERTFYDWMTRGKRESARVAAGAEPDPNETKFAEFFEAVLEAEYKAEATLVTRVRVAAAENPTIALKLLQLRHPERWGDRREVSIRTENAFDSEMTPGEAARATIKNARARELALEYIDALALEEEEVLELEEAEVIETTAEITDGDESSG